MEYLVLQYSWKLEFWGHIYIFILKVPSAKEACFEDIIFNFHIKKVILQANVESLNCKIRGHLIYWGKTNTVQTHLL